MLINIEIIWNLKLIMARIVAFFICYLCDYSKCVIMKSFERIVVNKEYLPFEYSESFEFSTNSI